MSAVEGWNGAVEGTVLGTVLVRNGAVVMRTAAFLVRTVASHTAYCCFPEREIISKVSLKLRQGGSERPCRCFCGSGTAAFTHAPHELAHDSHTGGEVINLATSSRVYSRTTVR